MMGMKCQTASLELQPRSMSQRCSLRRISSCLLSPTHQTRNRTHHLTPLYYLTLLLNQCSTFNQISQAHTFMLARGLDQDNLLLSKFIHVCSSLGFKDYAFTLFQCKPSPDLHLYNTMIRSLSQSDSARDAIDLFNKIQAAGFRPDTYSFPFLLKAAAHLSNADVGREAHGQVVRLGFEFDIHVSTGLVHMYSACRSISDARQLFDEIHQKDVVLWNAMVAGYSKVGDPESARLLFDRMSERNLISWTSMIAGYAQMNRADEAVVFFRRMQVEDGIEPDEVASLSALSACAQLGALNLGEWIHSFIDKHCLHKTIPLSNALIDMYAKAGDIWKAFDVFESMMSRSIVTWTTMIAGFALHGLGSEALQLFDRMESEGVKPNGVTFIAILSACSHVGDVELGRRYFSSMKSFYDVEPQIEHYGCMIDILGRAGCLREARDQVREMPFKPNAAIWGSLLSASRIVGDVEVGQEALKHLIEVEPENSGNYSILSNIHAIHGNWDDAGRLRRVMKDWGVVKVPGGSSIELDGKVHEFTSMDGLHPSLEEIYGVLDEMKLNLKINWYAPRFCEGVLEVESFIS